MIICYSSNRKLVCPLKTSLHELQRQCFFWGKMHFPVLGRKSCRSCSGPPRPLKATSWSGQYASCTGWQCPLLKWSRHSRNLSSVPFTFQKAFYSVHISVTWRQNGNWKFLASFSVSFYPPPSLSSGLTHFDFFFFFGGGETEEGEKQAEKEAWWTGERRSRQNAEESSTMFISSGTRWRSSSLLLTGYPLPHTL